MTLLVLDPKLIDLRGHHFYTDLALYEECRARQIPIDLLANRRVEPGILTSLPAARPFFSVPALPADTPSHDPHGDFLRGTETVKRDLKDGGLGALGADDVVLAPSRRDGHLGGLYRWYIALPEPRPRVCLRLLFEPGFGTHNGTRHGIGTLAEEQIRAWASLPKSKLTVVAESRELAGFYEQQSNLRVRVLPMLIRDPPPRATEVLAPAQPPHVVFLGEGRREKGFHLLPQALRTVLERYPQLRVTVQTGQRCDIDPRDVQSWQLASRLDRPRPAGPRAAQLGALRRRVAARDRMSRASDCGNEHG